MDLKITGFFFQNKSSVLSKQEQKSLLKKEILKLILCSFYNERQKRFDTVFSI